MCEEWLQDAAREITTLHASIHEGSKIRRDLGSEAYWCEVSALSKPPSIEIIREELVRLIEANINTCDANLKAPVRRLMEHLKHSAGDKAFMLDVLSTVTDRNHPFFAKDYLPPKKISSIQA